MTPRSIAAVFTTLAILLLPATPALAAGASSGSKATRLVYVGSDARVGLNDNGTPGASAGDVRTLALTLKTPRGAIVGTVDVVQTLTDEGAVDRAVKVLVITLPKGTIAAQGLTTFTNFTDQTARPNDKIEQIAIVGGTGKYRGASGMIDIEVLPGFTSRWIISLD
jgi:hypothetical protein